MPITLRDYQEAAVNKLLNPPPEIHRSLLVLPTGSGKTVVFAAFVDRFLKKGERALVLAHREELIHQANDTFREVAPNLCISIEKAKSHGTKPRVMDARDENERSVVIGSTMTLQGARLREWPKDSFRTIVVDEAHHALAPGYLDILNWFGCMDAKTRLVGVTATPMRTDGAGLDRVFQEIAFERGIKEMIQQGHLAPVQSWEIKTSTNLRGVHTAAGDFNASELEKAVNNHQRNLEVVAAYQKYASGMSAIVFCAGVNHSKELTKLLNSRGVKTEHLDAQTDSQTRAQAIARFQHKETLVLSNYGVLTEGFNAPGIQCVIAARPTQSQLLFTQMIGRGLRLHPNKPHLLVLDVSDVASKSLMSAASLAGLPPKFNPQGGNVYRMAQLLKDIDPDLRELVRDKVTLDRIISHIQAGMTAVQIKILEGLPNPDKAASSLKGLNWNHIGDNQWAINDGHKEMYEIRLNRESRHELNNVEEAGSQNTDKGWTRSGIEHQGHRLLDIWKQDGASLLNLNNIGNIATERQNAEKFHQALGNLKWRTEKAKKGVSLELDSFLNEALSNESVVHKLESYFKESFKSEGDDVFRGTPGEHRIYQSLLEKVKQAQAKANEGSSRENAICLSDSPPGENVDEMDWQPSKNPESAELPEIPQVAHKAIPGGIYLSGDSKNYFVAKLKRDCLDIKDEIVRPLAEKFVKLIKNDREGDPFLWVIRRGETIELDEAKYPNKKIAHVGAEQSSSSRMIVGPDSSAIHGAGKNASPGVSGRHSLQREPRASNTSRHSPYSPGR